MNYVSYLEAISSTITFLSFLIGGFSTEIFLWTRNTNLSFGNEKYLIFDFSKLPIIQEWWMHNLTSIWPYTYKQAYTHFYQPSQIWKQDIINPQNFIYWGCSLKHESSVSNMISVCLYIVVCLIVGCVICQYAR